MGEPQLPGWEEHFSQRKQHVQRAWGRRKIGTLVDLEGHVCGQSKVREQDREPCKRTLERDMRQDNIGL